METCCVDGTWASLRWGCAGELTIQHAVGRGMGGSAKYDNIDFLRTMCARHNMLETADADFAKACVENGWSIPRWFADRFSVRAVPVLYSEGWYLLQNGNRLPISDKTAESIKSDFED